MRRRINCISGWFFATAWAMCCKRIVLPVRGGATIRPRCPLPMGVSMSITRVVNGSAPGSRTFCSRTPCADWLSFDMQSYLLVAGRRLAGSIRKGNKLVIAEEVGRFLLHDAEDGDSELADFD